MLSEKNTIIELKSNTPGKKVVISTCVHGDERCGVEAVNSLLENIELVSGELTLVLANPNAYVLNTRQTDFNLNRCFKKESEYSEDQKSTYEWNRAQELKQVLNNCDVLIDIHASFTKESEPFVICERNSDEITKYLPPEFKKIVYGFDAVEPGGTDYYMNSIGKIGVCIECGYLGDGQAARLAESAILNCLTSLGLIESANQLDSVIDRQYIQMDSLYYTKTDTFVLSKDFSDFEVILSGQEIGRDGDNDVIAKGGSVILFARNRSQAGDEAFLLGHYI